MSSTITAYELPLWDADYCLQIREVALSVGKEWVPTVGDNEENTEIRKATGYGMERDDHENEQAMEDLITAALTVNAWNFRLYANQNISTGFDVIRYKPGDFYTTHTDWGSIQGNRKISVTVQLSDPSEYKGGEMVMHNGPEAQVINKTQGTATFFPSWTLHEVKPVTEGDRWALVCFFCGPPYC